LNTYYDLIGIIKNYNAKLKVPETMKSYLENAYVESHVVDVDKYIGLWTTQLVFLTIVDKKKMSLWKREFCQ
jgi:hypothetical protein